MYCMKCGVELAEGVDLGAGAVVAGVDEVGGLTAGLGGEVAEGQHAGAHHESDKFLLISHDKRPLSFLFMGVSLFSRYYTIFPALIQG